MDDLTTLIKTVNVQHLSMQVCGLTGTGQHDSVPHAFLDALEHDMSINSTCASGQCSPFLASEDNCEDGCAVGTVALGRGWLPEVVDGPNFEEDFEDWYYAARTVAISRRNAELESRVHSAVLRLLPFLRVTLNATAMPNASRLRSSTVSVLFLEAISPQYKQRDSASTHRPRGVEARRQGAE